MYNCQVVLYAQTGFNGVDIPDSIQTLQRNFDPYKIYDDINIIQGEYIASIILDDLTPDEARRIDYITIKDKDTEYRTCNCYTIESFEFLADGTCQFNLYIDAFNTLGGFADDSGNQVLGGSAKRLSVSLEEDNTKYFINPEPFAPAEKNKTEFVNLGYSLDPSVMTEIPLIETLTIPPITIEAVVDKTAKDVAGNGIQMKKITANPEGNWAQRQLAGGVCGEYVVATEQNTSLGSVKSVSYGTKISPQTRNIIHGTNDTELNNVLLWGNNNTIMLGTKWWNAYNINAEFNTIKSNLIDDMRMAGRDNDIINYWVVPQIYITIPINDFGYSLTETDASKIGIKNIINNIKDVGITYTPIKVYNNKARYKQSAEIKVFSNASGEEINKEVYEVLATGTPPNSESFYMGGKITADLRPQGTPIFLFNYENQTLQNQSLSTYIKGGRWRQISLGINGLSGENQKQAEIKAEKEMANKNALFHILGGLALAGIGVASGGVGVPLAKATLGQALGGTAFNVGLASVGLGGSEVVKSNFRQQEQQQILNSASINASSQINIGNSEYCRDTAGNIFWGMITEYSDEDMVAYDTFLTRYGYNVGNKVLKQTDFYSRPAFNFVQINDIDIESVTGSLQMIEMCKQQLKAGVRIWHVKPNYNDMLASGNRG